MVNRSLKVRVEKETSQKVTIHIMALNRSMPVPKEDFKRRVENGLYEVINKEVLSDSDSGEE